MNMNIAALVYSCLIIGTIVGIILGRWCKNIENQK